MKKIKLFFVLLLSSVALHSQTLCDFEALSLPADSFWNGADLSGDFSVNQVIFPNYYDTSFGGFWSSGWAYSNRTDSSTVAVDISNYATYLYNAKTAHGNNASQNYLIGTQGSTIILDSNSNRPKGVFVTNTTYAYNSMKLGDGFAKQFGGTSGNDPDYFKLVIRNYVDGSLSNDSVYVFLADYRDSDNTQDYILRDWVYVSLDAFEASDSLLFTLSSSDAGTFGMNTPAYFALDDVSFDSTLSVPQYLVARELPLFPNPVLDVLHISEEIEFLNITNTQGQVIYSQQVKNTKIDLQYLPSGTYFIQGWEGKTYYTNRFVKL